MSDLLLDTHALLWASNEVARLGPRTRDQLHDSSHRLFVSAVSSAEIVIKRSIGKLVMTLAIDDLLGPLGEHFRQAVQTPSGNSAAFSPCQ